MKTGMSRPQEGRAGGGEGVEEGESSWYPSLLLLIPPPFPCLSVTQQKTRLWEVPCFTGRALATQRED